ncbi:hypothetical protein FQR65_LT20957 [Abscondita terminalis]|nr:hypothetical protein FQR65_LT20957 [Abscondita terminalis]
MASAISPVRTPWAVPSADCRAASMTGRGSGNRGQPAHAWTAVARATSSNGSAGAPPWIAVAIGQPGQDSIKTRSDPICRAKVQRLQTWAIVKPEQSGSPRPPSLAELQPALLVDDRASTDEAGTLPSCLLDAGHPLCQDPDAESNRCRSCGTAWHLPSSPSFPSFLVQGHFIDITTIDDDGDGEAIPRIERHHKKRSPRVSDGEPGGQACRWDGHGHAIAGEN